MRGRGEQCRPIAPTDRPAAPVDVKRDRALAEVRCAFALLPVAHHRPRKRGSAPRLRAALRCANGAGLP